MSWLFIPLPFFMGEVLSASEAVGVSGCLKTHSLRRYRGPLRTHLPRERGRNSFSTEAIVSSRTPLGEPGPETRMSDPGSSPGTTQRETSDRHLEFISGSNPLPSE